MSQGPVFQLKDNSYSHHFRSNLRMQTTLLLNGLERERFSRLQSCNDTQRLNSAQWMCFLLKCCTALTCSDCYSKCPSTLRKTCYWSALGLAAKSLWVQSESRVYFSLHYSLCNVCVCVCVCVLISEWCEKSRSCCFTHSHTHKQTHTQTHAFLNSSLFYVLMMSQ